MIDERSIPTLRRLAAAAQHQLEQQILPFWLSLEDTTFGGYFEAVDAAGRIHPDAPKTTIFLSRLLWTMSEAARRFGRADCAGQARRTYLFLDRLRDAGPLGGYFAAATRDGRPTLRHKHVYAQAFVIFGLSAYAMAAGDRQALARAVDLFRIVEARARDRETGLYLEAFDASWQEIANHDRALGETVAPHTADTHLHLIEAYTQLLRAAPVDEVRSALHALVETFLARFVAADGSFAHQKLGRSLAPVRGAIWPGHDIEASWLLGDACDLLGDAALAARARGAANGLARGAVRHGAAPDGSWTERRWGDRQDPWRLWWVQAEAVVGTLDEGLRSGDAEMIERAAATWSFIETRVADRPAEDWRLRVAADGSPDPDCPRVVFWKDAYHQARACIEVAGRSAAALGRQ